MRKQGPGFALPVLGFAHGREGRRSDQGQSSHGGKDLWPADGGGTGAGAGRCDGAGTLVPLHLPARGRDHHPGHQSAPGDHPELRLSAHPRTDDLIGQRFGRLTVLALTEARGSNGGAVWQCQCDCGAQCQVPAGNLRQGRTVSCGCVRREDLTGQRAAAGRGWHSLAVPVPVRSGEIDPPGRPGGRQNPELRLHHRPRQRENRPDAHPRGYCLCSGIHPWGFAGALPLRLCGVPPGEAGLPHCVRRCSPYHLQRPGLGHGSPVSPHPGQRWAEKCLLCPEGHPPAAHSPHPVCPAVAAGFGVGNESLPPLTAGPWRGCAGTTAGTGRQWQGRSSRRDGARPPPLPSGHGGGGGRGTGPGTGRPTAGASRWW